MYPYELSIVVRTTSKRRARRFEFHLQKKSRALTLTSGEGDVAHGRRQMAYALPAVSYGNGNINGPHGSETEPPKLPAAPLMTPLALAEARVSQVEAELRLALVETQVSCLEERLSPP